MRTVDEPITDDAADAAALLDRAREALAARVCRGFG